MVGDCAGVDDAGDERRPCDQASLHRDHAADPQWTVRVGLACAKLSQPGHDKGGDPGHVAGDRQRVGRARVRGEVRVEGDEPAAREVACHRQGVCRIVVIPDIERPVCGNAQRSHRKAVSSGAELDRGTRADADRLPPGERGAAGRPSPERQRVGSGSAVEQADVRERPAGKCQRVGSAAKRHAPAQRGSRVHMDCGASVRLDDGVLVRAAHDGAAAEVDRHAVARTCRHLDRGFVIVFVTSDRSGHVDRDSVVSVLLDEYAVAPAACDGSVRVDLDCAAMLLVHVDPGGAAVAVLVALRSDGGSGGDRDREAGGVIVVYQRNGLVAAALGRDASSSGDHDVAALPVIDSDPRPAAHGGGDGDGE